MSDRLSEAASETDVSRSKGKPNVDAVDLVEESVVVFGLYMRVTAWNTEAEHLYGWKREDVLGGGIRAVVCCVPS